VHPAIAATAVFSGTVASVLSPAHVLNAVLFDVSGAGVMEIVRREIAPGVVAILIMAIVLTVVAFICKEDSGYVAEDSETNDEEAPKFKMNIIKALVPMLPLVLLIIGSESFGIFENEMTVPEAMLIGTFVAFLVSLIDPQQITKVFFEGMGSAYGKIIGIIIAATVFTTGVELIGLMDVLISTMENSDSSVGLAATFEPFLLATFSGSGTASTVTFHTSLTPNAAVFGLDMVDLGILANISGALGRMISPVTGAAIICAGTANVTPMDLVKRNLPGAVIAAIVVMFILVM